MNDAPAVAPPAPDSTKSSEPRGSVADSWTSERAGSETLAAPDDFGSGDEEDESEASTGLLPPEPTPQAEPPKKRKPRQESLRRNDVESDSTAGRTWHPREDPTVRSSNRDASTTFPDPARPLYRPMYPDQRVPTNLGPDEPRPTGNRSFSLSGGSRPTPFENSNERGSWDRRGALRYNGTSIVNRPLPSLSSSPTPSLGDFIESDRMATWRSPPSLRQSDRASTGEPTSRTRMRTMVGPLPTAPEFDQEVSGPPAATRTRRQP